MKRAIIETRTKKAPGTWPKQGPDGYVAVQIVPDGVQPLTSLRGDVARKRGIEIVRCGEYYRNSTGPRSKYAAALKEAERIVQEINGTKRFKYYGTKRFSR